ncbi:arylsulfatase [Oligosphaera ethanolica]|uniref:Arylsulfatase A-like enzyme n=1 Tax=Oligosphaera ethanolica TaxID=760260 RepID=A0AAE4AP45_9BACT|nr:arylsulfatase [Oligosphaera ethanolica]MDQ0290140.1 arylsulfatase A-like enzyme [Oligosphaera ethanolica]
MSRPNIILVLTDDQGYGDLGCTGNPWLQTPAIDAFAAEAARMTDYHVGPTCAPTRAGLLTGHYANSTGVWHTIGGRSLLRANEVTLANALADHGYATAIFGKWHLGDSYPYRPQDRGFQHSVIHGGGGISQTPDYWGNDYFDDHYFVNGSPQPFQGYCTDVFFAEAMAFMEQCQNQPFFCYLATNAPHSPYNVDDRYADLYRGKVQEDRARFYGMITNIDENFGRLRRFLAERGLEDNTILIFMTDNGSSAAMSFKDGELVEGFNAGLRGMKGSEYDGGHRTPFFLRWPAGGIAGSHEISDLTANVDVMPTLLDLCSIPYNPQAFHGLSIKALLNGDSTALPERIVVTDSQRVVSPIKWRKSAAMLGPWRLVNGCELYNTAADRAQQHDIAQDHPELVQKLRAGYESWWCLVSQQMDEPIPLHVHCNETCLTAHDWRGDESNCVWNQGMIRNGELKYGEWEVMVENKARYLIAFSRWPQETPYALGDGIAGNDSGFSRERTPRNFWTYYEGGRPLAICTAELVINGQVVANTTIGKNDRCATFTTELPAGFIMLGGRFRCNNGTVLGAYYAHIRQADE